jgi:hypothetical protein
MSTKEGTWSATPEWLKRIFHHCNHQGHLMTDKAATPMTDALLRELQPANTDRELDLARLGRKLEADRARLIEALTVILKKEGFGRGHRGEPPYIPKARALLRELEPK